MASQRLTGKDGAATIGGVTVILMEWEFEGEQEDADVTAAGDDYRQVAATFKNWKARARGRKASGSVSSEAALWGADAAIVLKIEGNTNTVSATGLCNRFRVTSPHDNPVEVEFEVKNQGTGPTFA
jgi:hypothetical protein